MKIKYTSLLTAAVISVSAAAVSASTIDVTYQESGNPFGTPSLQKTVRIASPDYNGRVRAGMFRLSGSNGFGDFNSFCIDLGHSLSSNDTYTASETSPFSAAVTDNIERLYNSAYASVSTARESAAFQLAIWEIITDTGNSLDLASGDFKVLGTGVKLLNMANGYLAGLAGASAGGYEFTYLQSRVGQDQLTVSPVPVPAGIGLLGLGLAGLFGLRRRKKA